MKRARHQHRVTSLAASVALLGLLTVLPLGMASGCRQAGGSGSSSGELIVSAAVSLKEAFTEIGALEEKQNHITVRFNFGASGALEKQLESGAPADVFAAAGSKQMDDLDAKHLIDPATRKDFARNVLILIVPANGTGVASFQDLNKAEVKKVAVGNPKTVPAGQYTQQALTHLKLLPANQSKLIYAEDVRQVLDYVVRGEVDAGVVYSSDALSAGSQVRMVAHAPTGSHDPILYPIAVLKDSRQSEAARKFVDLVLSPEGQHIIAKHGFVATK